MTKHLLTTICLMLLLFWPTQAQEIATTTPTTVPAFRLSEPSRITTVSETNYLNALALRGMRLETHGVLFESLNGSTIFADLNSNVAFNPASVIKLATSFAALSKFGPVRHFETVLYSDGVVDKKRRTLTGNLVLKSDGDPSLSSTDITKMVRQVIRAGIARVTGSLIVTGPFTYGSYYSNESASRALGITMRRLGLRLANGVKTSADYAETGTRLASILSPSLQDILFFQNAHSSNPIAERLGHTLGGPKAVERFLIDRVGIPITDIYISRASGLDYNRITARGTIDLLRTMYQYLEANNLRPEDVMPVAGADPGTLRTRFRTDPFRGGVVAKTGTLPGTDGGVSTLAGILYTKQGGPVLFAIFNTKGNVNRFRQMQDGLLKDFMTELGGVLQPINASLRRSNN